MREFQARKHQSALVSRIIHSKVFLVFLCVLIFFILRGTIRVYKNYTIASDDLKRIKTDIDTLQKRDAELDIQLKHLETDNGKDYEIRQKLDVVKPGEKVIQIIEAPENTR